jgi:hypothetical protein
LPRRVAAIPPPPPPSLPASHRRRRSTRPPAARGSSICGVAVQAATHMLVGTWHGVCMGTTFHDPARLLAVRAPFCLLCIIFLLLIPLLITFRITHSSCSHLRPSSASLGMAAARVAPFSAHDCCIGSRPRLTPRLALRCSSLAPRCRLLCSAFTYSAPPPKPPPPSPAAAISRALLHTQLQSMIPALLLLDPIAALHANVPLCASVLPLRCARVPSQFDCPDTCTSFS